MPRTSSDLAPSTSALPEGGPDQELALTEKAPLPPEASRHAPDGMDAELRKFAAGGLGFPDED